jgi:hypothetical protein
MQDMLHIPDLFFERYIDEFNERAFLEDPGNNV